MSLRPSIVGWPRACSGLMYCTVPTVKPEAVLAPPSPPPGSSSFAIPKSTSRARPVVASREMNGQDRLVLQPRQGLRLLAEARQHPWRPRDLGVEDLAGEPAVEVLVP